MMTRSLIWAVLSITLCYGWALVFWRLFFIKLSWEIMSIPMGLGGALYPKIFTLPILIGTVFYQIVLFFIIRNTIVTNFKRLMFTLWIPFVVIAVLLIICCPMDINQSFFFCFCSYVIGNK